jgi:3-dehydroquinate synthase
MTAARHERGQPLIALGGGIVGDLAGFAAATYRRGIPLVHCPTTLLAMVDASIGGKTGVNIALGAGAEGSLKKNMAGAFHQPTLVLSDVEVLRSLDARQFRTGLAECIKHALIGAHGGEPALLPWLEDRLPTILAQDPATLVELVTRNVRLKAAIIDGDEREELPDGGRILLNLGHTFGHAIETLPHLTPDGDPAKAPLLHGEAVALGLVAAAETARELDLCDAAAVDRILAIISRCGLPVEINGLPPADRIVALMGFDKKVAEGKLRLILPVGLGAAKVLANPPLPAILAGLEAIRA